MEYAVARNRTILRTIDFVVLSEALVHTRRAENTPLSSDSSTSYGWRLGSTPSLPPVTLF